MTQKRFELRLCSNGRYYLYKNKDIVIPYVDFDKFNKESADVIITALNMLVDENEQLREENNLLKNSEAVTDQKELQKLIFQTIINLIDEKIKKYQSKSQLPIKMPVDCKYKHSCLHNQEINVCNASKLAILKELREELYQE